MSIRVVVMGVAGCGKSTIGALLADHLGVPFIDGDGLHPLENVTKMAAGIPLEDSDRWPWLDEVGATMARHSSVVLACSALRRAYRDRIRRAAPDTVFVHLDGSREVLSARLAARSGHFMPASLLDSQLAVLEPLAPDESGIVVDVSADVSTIVAEITAEIETALRAG